MMPVTYKQWQFAFLSINQDCQRYLGLRIELEEGAI
jgi:hypothetical protein